nr:DUF2798 domain-containing protein [Oceanobacter mangrovi]
MKLRLIHSALMSGILSLLMTCWITYINLGYSSHFFGLWMKAWSLAWPPAFVIAFSTGPAILKLAQRLSR